MPFNTNVANKCIEYLHENDHTILQLLLNKVLNVFDNRHLFSRLAKLFRECAGVFNN